MVQLSSSCTRLSTGESSERRKQKRSSASTSTSKQSSQPSQPQLTLGSRVIRGSDWKWGIQDDCSASSSLNEGTVIGEASTNNGWCEIIWDSGAYNFYRYLFKKNFMLYLLY